MYLHWKRSSENKTDLNPRLPGYRARALTLRSVTATATFTFVNGKSKQGICPKLFHLGSDDVNRPAFTAEVGKVCFQGSYCFKFLFWLCRSSSRAKWIKQTCLQEQVGRPLKLSWKAAFGPLDGLQTCLVKTEQEMIDWFIPVWKRRHCPMWLVNMQAVCNRESLCCVRLHCLPDANYPGFWSVFVASPLCQMGFHWRSGQFFFFCFCTQNTYLQL